MMVVVIMISRQKKLAQLCHVVAVMVWHWRQSDHHLTASNHNAVDHYDVSTATRSSEKFAKRCTDCSVMKRLDWSVVISKVSLVLHVSTGGRQQLMKPS